MIKLYIYLNYRKTLLLMRYIIILLNFRILEFESDNLNIGGRIGKAEVELWDCSGDTKLIFL